MNLSFSYLAIPAGIRIAFLGIPVKDPFFHADRATQERSTPNSFLDGGSDRCAALERLADLSQNFRYYINILRLPHNLAASLTENHTPQQALKRVKGD